MTICPECKGRATKIVSITTGEITCQQCNYKWMPGTWGAIVRSNEEESKEFRKSLDRLMITPERLNEFLAKLIKEKK